MLLCSIQFCSVEFKWLNYSLIVWVKFGLQTEFTLTVLHFISIWKHVIPDNNKRSNNTSQQQREQPGKLWIILAFLTTCFYSMWFTCNLTAYFHLATHCAFIVYVEGTKIDCKGGKKEDLCCVGAQCFPAGSIQALKIPARQIQQPHSAVCVFTCVCFRFCFRLNQLCCT